jgi:hypothetical protein
MGMMTVESESPCGSCVNDPNDCSNYLCDACPDHMIHVDNGECCGTCIAKKVCEVCPKGMMIVVDGTECGSCVNDPEDCSNI